MVHQSKLTEIDLRQIWALGQFIIENLERQTHNILLDIHRVNLDEGFV